MDFGLNVGDIVTFASENDNTGGCIYQIVFDQTPIAPHTTRRTTTRTRTKFNWRDNSKSQETETYEHVEHGRWDEQGRKIKPCDVAGYVRIKPLFTFYPTPRGKKPKGAGETIMVYYGHGVSQLKKVEVADLGAKYVELGELMKFLLRKGGAEL